MQGIGFDPDSGVQRGEVACRCNRVSDRLVNVGMNQVGSFVRAYPAGAIGLAFFCMLLLTNVSESIFARRSPLSSAFLLTAIGYWFLARAPDNTEQSVAMDRSYEYAAEGKATDFVAF